MQTARNKPRRILVQTCLALALSLVSPLTTDASAASVALDRIRQAGKVMFGYQADSRPFSQADAGSAPAGYSVTLCEKVADEVKSELGLTELAVEWVPVTLDDRFAAIDQGRIDLLCASSSVTLERREQVSFSIPIYPGGIAAMMRADAPRALQDVLAGRPASGPIWRASPAQILTSKTFAVVKGTTGESWIAERLRHFQLTANVAPVESYSAGVSQLLDRAADVFFGERPLLVEAAAGSPSPDSLIILDKLFTAEPVALALARNDDDFRLVVDRALSGFFPTPAFRDLYTKWFGTPDDAIVTFIRQSALPK